MSRSISLVFFLLLLSAPMARAGARPEPGAVPADRDGQVDLHVERAKRAFRAGDFDGSVKEWDLAYELDPAPIFLFNTGNVWRRGGEYKKAILRYRMFVDKDPSQTNLRRQEALSYIRELSALLAERERPLWKKAWFWTAVVVATGGIATWVGLGLAARPPDVSGTPGARPFAN